MTEIRTKKTFRLSNFIYIYITYQCHFNIFCSLDCYLLKLIFWKYFLRILLQHYILYRNVLNYNLGNWFEIGAPHKNTTTKTETPIMSQTPDKLHNLDIFLLQKCIYRPKIFKLQNHWSEAHLLWSWEQTGAPRSVSRTDYILCRRGIENSCHRNCD